MVCVAYKHVGKAIKGYIFIDKASEYAPRDSLEKAVARNFTRGKGYIIKCGIPAVDNEFEKKGYGYVLFEHNQPKIVGTNPDTLVMLSNTLKYLMPVFHVVISEYGAIQHVGAT